MRLHVSKGITLPVLLFACAGLVFSQPPPPGHTEERPAAQKLVSPEEILEQLSHRMAAIYRAIAGLSDKDPDRVGELSRQYVRLAQEAENAAAALKSMEAYHEHAAAASQPASLLPISRASRSDSAFRR